MSVQDEIAAAFLTVFGVPLGSLPPGPVGADEGPDPDPDGADCVALDRRAHDRTSEVFDA